MSTATGARSLALIHWILGTMSNTFNAPLVTHSGQCCLQTREGSFGTQRTGSSWASDCPNWWLNVQPQESGLPKKALPAPSSESWTDFFNKKIYIYFFWKRQTTSTEYSGLGFRKKLQNSFTEMLPLGHLSHQKIKKCRYPGSSCWKSAFWFAEELPIYTLSQLMLTSAIQQQLHSHVQKKLRSLNWRTVAQGHLAKGQSRTPALNLLIVLKAWSRQAIAQAIRLHGMWTQKASRFLFDHTRFAPSCNLAHALRALSNYQRNHLPHQRSYPMSPHGHKVFTFQSSLFSTPPPPTSQCITSTLITSH